ncbi:MAG: hypothetical protein CMP60_02050 [Flavobacteriales bacterium]|nr:hypothetical protein [Flavobacteriales bacterium]MDG1718481.1 hypothetical protein [Flavobacteriales bacterium]|tara:strand:+ start:57 stop:713 length:657 start_codon:yes stop_codon:yes gene_type:complete
MKFSKILSYLLHPILMPIIVLYISINHVDYFSLIFHNYSNTLYIIVLIFTMVLPLISAILFMKLGRVESLEMRKRKERRGPLFISILIMIIGFPIFYSIAQLSFHLSAIYISSIMLLFVSYLITIRWKISLHMLGIGGATGSFIALNYIFGGIYYCVVLFFFLSGLLSFSRLDQKSHNESQVYVGFFLGCVFQSLFIVNYSSIISTISILRSSIASLL